MIDDRLSTAFTEAGVPWTIIEHPPVFTVEESEAIHAAMPGAHTKNLFLKDGGGQYWLVTVEHDKRVDLKALANVIGARKLSFGKAEDMARLLGVTPGSVTPLAAINDNEGAVRLVLDTDLADADQVNVHPLRNTATIGLASVDLVRLLSQWRHGPSVIVIPERPMAAP